MKCLKCLRRPRHYCCARKRRVYPRKKRKNWTMLHRKRVCVCVCVRERERARARARERRERERERERESERAQRERERENHTHSTQKHSYLSRGGSAPLETPRPHHLLRLLRRACGNFFSFRVSDVRCSAGPADYLKQAFANPVSIPLKQASANPVSIPNAPRRHEFAA